MVARQLSDDDIDLFTRQNGKAVKDPNCNRVTSCDENAIYRTIDGTCNNLENTLWGSAGIQHKRILPFAYDFGTYYRFFCLFYVFDQNDSAQAIRQ